MSMNQYEIDFQQGYDACNDKWIEKLELIRAEIEERVKSLEWKQKCVDEILEIIDKAIKEVEQ